MQNMSGAISVVGAMVLFAVSVEGATTRYVAHDGQTPGGGYTAWSSAASNIQDAVTAAAIGDTIIVGPGRYTGANALGGVNYVFHTYDKPLTVRSSAGSAATLIDGEGVNKGVLFGTDNPGCLGPYVLDGFTVSNCYGTATLPKGGAGVHLYTGNYAVTSIVQNCVITHNTTTDPDSAGGVGGGGVNGGHLHIISNVVVRSNTGGGVYNYGNHNGARLLLTQSLVEENSGPGVVGTGYLGTNYIWNTIIRGNANSASGGGIANYNAPLRVWNCLVANNSANNSRGGAIYIENNTDAEIYNCTIVSNTVPLRWYEGAGVGVHWNAGVRVWNTICVSNITDNGYVEDFYISGTAAYTNSCCTSQALPGDGNSTNEPGFVDFAGRDYRLTDGSPCVNTGTNQAWMVGAVDLAGYPRVDYGPGVVDRGCYERPAYSLVRNGQPLADIVIAPNPPRMVSLAATELQEYLFKITGAELPIVTNPTPNGPAHLYVGESSNTMALGLSTTGLLHDAFQMVSGTNWLALLGHDSDFTAPPSYVGLVAGVPTDYTNWDALTGGTWDNPMVSVFRAYNTELGVWAYDERGSLNAVHEFLRSLGVRWYFPGDIGEVVPSMQTLAIPVTNAVVRPDFAMRHLYFYYHEFFAADADEVKWQLRLGLNLGWKTIGSAGLGHGILPVISRNEMTQGHPDYYALWGGIRTTNPPAPCLSSEGLYTQNVAYARALFDIYSNDTPAISVMPSDGYSYLCECPLCNGKATPERGELGKLSDYVWNYVNRVATNLLATHPDRKVTCCAYTTYQLPPTNIVQLSSNVVMGWCAWRSDFQDAAAWASYTSNVTLWMDKLPSEAMFHYDYYLHSNQAQWDGVPFYFPRLIAQDLRFQKGKSLGEFIEVYRNYWQNNDTWEALAANHLNCYVTSRLWWNADQDLDALLDEYYEKFYGPAADEMKTFVEFCETNSLTLRSNYAALCTMFDLLDAARSAAGSSGVYSQRIDLVNGYVQRLVPVRDSMAPHFVAQNGQTPVSPYLTWATAASNIQDAVNVAASYTTITVGPGRYTGSTAWEGANNVVCVSDKPLTIRSSGGAAVTIIDGEGANRGVWFGTDNPGRLGPYVLDGFTVSNCYTTSKSAGVRLYTGNYAVTSVVQNCVITHNTTTDANGVGGVGGGGTAGGHLHIISNVIVRSNTGGGVYNYGNHNDARMILTQSLVENNTGPGVVAAGWAGTNYIWSTIIRGNVNAGSGGGIANYNVPLRLRNCLIANNSSSSSRGGAVYVENNYNAEIENCTIVSNTVPLRWYEGAGVGVHWNAGVKVWNTICVSNRTDNGYVEDFYITGTAAYTNVCCTSQVLPGDGNMTNEPAFADFSGRNFRLSRGSPCINKGTNQAWMIGAVDLDGSQRVNSVSGIVDMGAYEYAEERDVVVNNAGGASGVTVSSAWLNGNLMSTGGAPTRVFIYWGRTDGGTNPVNWGKTNNLGIKPTGVFSNRVTSLATNTLYYYRCCASNSMGRSWAAETTNFWTMAALPAVNNTGGATGIAATTAWMRGGLTSTGGAPTTVFIYWGLTDRTTNTALWSNTNNLGIRSTGLFSNQVSGLAPNTRYYYRCSATNKAGRVWASTTSNFWTLASVPAVNNHNGAVGIATTNAWLMGNLTSTGGAPTRVFIYWGASDGGTNKASWGNTNNLGMRSMGVFSNKVTGLISGTLYYYRCCATNRMGTTWAASSTNFTTPSSKMSSPSPMAPEALSDLDGDGVTYANEILSGTNPDGSNSCLRITGLEQVAPEAIRLTLHLGSNRTYTILSVDQAGTVESLHGSITTGREGLYYWVDTNATKDAPLRFYGIGVSGETGVATP